MSYETLDVDKIFKVFFWRERAFFFSFFFASSNLIIAWRRRFVWYLAEQYDSKSFLSLLNLVIIVWIVEKHRNTIAIVH